MLDWTSAERPWRRSRIVVPVANPAAGADWSLTCPPGHTYRVLTVRGVLTTSAAVATRVANLAYGDGVRTYLSVPPPNTLAASLAATFGWFVGAVSLIPGAVWDAPIPDLTLEPGWTIGSGTAAIDVADQWSGVFVSVIDTTVKAAGVQLDELPDVLVQVIPGLSV